MVDVKQKGPYNRALRCSTVMGAEEEKEKKTCLAGRWCRCYNASEKVQVFKENDMVHSVHMVLFFKGSLEMGNFSGQVSRLCFLMMG